MNKYEPCGYCEYGYRLYRKGMEVYIFPIPYVFTKYVKGNNVEYWW